MWLSVYSFEDQENGSTPDGGGTLLCNDTVSDRATVAVLLWTDVSHNEIDKHSKTTRGLVTVELEKPTETLNHHRFMCVRWNEIQKRSG